MYCIGFTYTNRYNVENLSFKPQSKVLRFWANLLRMQLYTCEICVLGMIVIEKYQWTVK